MIAMEIPYRPERVSWGPNTAYNVICPECQGRVLEGPATGFADIQPCRACTKAATRRRERRLVTDMERKRARRIKVRHFGVAKTG